jgi:formylglycine-generating enzyme required for sulfatase activity
MLEAVLANESVTSTLAQQAQTVGLIGAIQRDLNSVQFRFQHPRYNEMLVKVMQIFDAAGSARVPIEVRLEAADALGQAGDPRLEGSNWVPLASGTFRIGVQSHDPDACDYDPCFLPAEGPPCDIQLGRFEMARFPVTVEDFARFLAEGGYEQLELWAAGGHGRWDRPQDWAMQIQYPSRPVVGVSWYEAAAYCRWRGESVQLPTQQQWERAARGPELRPFPWGNERPDATRLNFTSEGKTLGRATPVGFYPSGTTPEGLLDMAGNIFEWCLDEYPGNETNRVVRGGCYRSVELFVRASFRGRYPADMRKDFIGYRICRFTEG